MSEKIYLAFCVHSHQPVGNHHKVFVKGARDCYIPFLRILEEYKDIRMTLHYTGPLLEWFERHEPEFFERMTAMVERNQVEIMGGAFYEPIIPVIPRVDAREQILMTSSYMENKFDIKPTGMWCAERIWDPGLPEKISGLGVEYTLLDDSHFLSSGLMPEEVHGYYLTEREGSSLNVFPIDMSLRYMIPFKEPHETRDYLLRLRDKGVRLVTYGDDGEKFGMWPGTYKWVIEQGWLKRFFDCMLEAGSDIELVPLAQAIDMTTPVGRIYLPTATYQEMMEWSLFCKSGRIYEDLVNEAKNNQTWQDKRAFLRGGMWDNFLAKYPESNLMHKKMIKVSKMVRDAGSPRKATRHLLMGQCNCAYWHGIFGGIYIRELRHAVYENLLKAEELIDSVRLKNSTWIVEKTDHDLDGRHEILLSSSTLNCYISPGDNASVFALEYKPLAYNLSNTLMRHPEIYHKDIEKIDDSPRVSADAPPSIHDISHGTGQDLRLPTNYDTYPRLSFMTHYLANPPSIEHLANDNLIPDSLTSALPFEHTETRESGENISLSFRATSQVFDITKTYTFDTDGCIRLSHQLVTRDKPGWLILEWNIMIVSGDRPLVGGEIMEQDRCEYRATNVLFKDQQRKMNARIESENQWDIVVCPIECVSQSESGFENTFQGWSVFFITEIIDDTVPDITFTAGESCPS